MLWCHLSFPILMAKSLKGFNNGLFLPLASSLINKNDFGACMLTHSLHGLLLQYFVHEIQGLFG